MYKQYRYKIYTVALDPCTVTYLLLVVESTMALLVRLANIAGVGSIRLQLLGFPRLAKLHVSFFMGSPLVSGMPL
jgi:hypothetical protein